MNIIAEEHGIDKELGERFAYFIRRFKIAKLLSRIGAGKLKGVMATEVFTFLFRAGVYPQKLI